MDKETIRRTAFPLAIWNGMGWCAVKIVWQRTESLLISLGGPLSHAAASMFRAS